MPEIITLEKAIQNLELLHKDYSTNNFEAAKDTYDVDFDHYSGDWDIQEYIPFTPEYESIFNELYKFIDDLEGDSPELNDLIQIDNTIPNNINKRTNNAFKYLKQYLNGLKAEQELHKQ